jgi:UDP-GlcNAc:undecaprenyl-phosphate GlcNAc-1-phosphate transferase
MVEFYLVVFAFLFSFLIALYAVPSLIKLAIQKRLFDDPELEERKIHKYRTPNLGGIAVMTAFAFTSCLFITGDTLPYANYIFASGLLIFSVGLKDDLAALNPYKKFFAQFITAFIVVYFADIRLTSFYGVFGIQQIDPIVSYSFSSLLIVFIINSFNLIDGVNGLLGSISLVVSLTFGVLFYMMDEIGLAFLSICMAGSIFGFLRYNFGRARIFMGDAGAYTIGFIISVLAIQLIELNSQSTWVKPVFQAVPAIAIALLFIPIFDTLRVIVIRLFLGKSPFLADRNHLHHRLLDTGMTHTQTTLTLVTLNVVMIGIALFFQKIGTVNLLILISIVTLIVTTMLWLYDVTREIPEAKEAEEILKSTSLLDEKELYNLKEDTRKVAKDALTLLEEKQLRN